MIKTALLTCDHLIAGLQDRPDSLGHVTDDSLLIEPLRVAGFDAEFVSWSAEEDWSRFELAIVRTTWDYTKHLTTFLKRIDEISKATKLWNPTHLIHWNAKKDYLVQLGELGIPTIPTVSLDAWDRVQIEDFANRHSGVVLKPLVGAGSKGAFFWKKSELDFSKLAANPLPYLMQPLLEEVKDGEYSLHFFAGELSHGIRKVPREGDYRSQEEYGSRITPYVPGFGELEFCERVFDRAPDRNWLFARVDYVLSKDGPLLMELELIEPSLYLRFDEKAPMRFAEALRRAL